MRRNGLPLDAEGGDEVFVQLEPHTMEGIAVGGGQPRRVSGGVLYSLLEALRVTAEPGQHSGQAGLQFCGGHRA